MQTETLDKLYLEISQFTKAKTAQEMELQSVLRRATILSHAGNGEQASRVALVFESDKDAEWLVNFLVRLRGDGERP